MGEARRRPLPPYRPAALPPYIRHGCSASAPRNPTERRPPFSGRTAAHVAGKARRDAPPAATPPPRLGNRAAVRHRGVAVPDPRRARAPRGSLDRQAHRRRGGVGHRQVRNRRRSGVAADRAAARGGIRRRPRGRRGGAWRVAAELGVAVVAAAASRAGALLESLLGDLCANRTSVRLMRHAAALDLEQLENADVYDKLERARRQTVGRISLFSLLLSTL